MLWEVSGRKLNKGQEPWGLGFCLNNRLLALFFRVVQFSSGRRRPKCVWWVGFIGLGLYMEQLSNISKVSIYTMRLCSHLG